MSAHRISIAQRLSGLNSSVIRQAFQLAHQRPSLIDLSIGYPVESTPDEVKDAGITAIQRNYTRYTPANGIKPLREGIAKKLERENGIAIDPAQVSVMPGTTTAILLVYLALLDPGDEILIPDPFFPPYRDVARLIGATPVLIDTAPHFQLTAEMVENKITPRTKVLVLNTPNNPSGAIYPEDELRKIAGVAEKHNLIIMSDEIYEYFAFDRAHFSIGSVYSQTVTLNGFAKSHSMTGWRIGYIAGPQEVIEAVNEIQQYVVFSSSSIAQQAALKALEVDPRPLVETYRAKRDITRQKLRSVVDLQAAEGALFAYIPVPGNDLDFVNEAIAHDVLVLPSRAFSARFDYARVAYVADPKALEQGLDNLCQALSASSFGATSPATS
jgi:aspartate/methionine/tyrosine aminotransferase